MDNRASTSPISFFAFGPGFRGISPGTHLHRREGALSRTSRPPRPPRPFRLPTPAS
jgi:hypothetical protein